LKILRTSALYETKPVGPEQPMYLNGAFLADCAHSPEKLLAQLQGIEDALGRERGVHWGPRTMDLDILLFGSDIIETPQLLVPHPFMLERLFVLVPAAEVAPEMIHPVKKLNLADLRDALAESLGKEEAAAAVRYCSPSGRRTEAD